MWRGFSNVEQYDSVLALSDFSLGKSSQSIHIHESDFALSMCLNHYSWIRTRYDPNEWKSIQASLFNQSHHNQSPSNTTREHFSNVYSPNLSDLREGKSSQSLTSQSFTLKHNIRTLLEWPFTELEWFKRRQVYSITHITIKHSQSQH